MLQLLQFEVGVHRDDPSTRVWLQRAAETEGITAKHVDWMGVICLEQRTRGLHRRPGHLCDTASHILPWGFVQVSESGLWAAVQASCGLSGSHSLTTPQGGLACAFKPPGTSWSSVGSPSTSRSNGDRRRCPRTTTRSRGCCASSSRPARTTHGTTPSATSRRRATSSSASRPPTARWVRTSCTGPPRTRRAGPRTAAPADPPRTRVEPTALLTPGAGSPRTRGTAGSASSSRVSSRWRRAGCRWPSPSPTSRPR